MLHVAHQATSGHKKISIRTVDSDVVVLAVATFHKLQGQLSELWVAYGTGQHFRNIPAHEIYSALGPERSAGLPLFHALTGCDTTSSFFGRGKRSAWDTWKDIRSICI